MRLMPVLLLAGALAPAMLPAAPLAAQQAYKWKDAAGVTHFTSEPPPTGQYEAREVDHRQAVSAAGDGPDAADARKPSADAGCATARNNLALLAGDGPLSMDTDGDGKAEPLSPADRDRQRALAQALIDVKCGGNAGAQPPEPEER